MLCHPRLLLSARCANRPSVIQRSHVCSAHCASKTKNRAKRSEAPHKRNFRSQQQQQHQGGQQQKDIALGMAAVSLKHVSIMRLREEFIQRGRLDSNPILSAVVGKVESATAVLQAALDSRGSSLTTREIDVMLAWEHVVALATGLANITTAANLSGRIFPAQHTFEVLESQGYNMNGAQDMFLLAPWTARLLCSAVPGFKVFLWLPPRLRYAMCAMQAEERLLQEPALLTEALGNPVTAANDWVGFAAPDEDDVMRGLASGSCFGRSIAQQNESIIYIMTADSEAAPSIYRAVKGGSGPWAVLPCDPYASDDSTRIDAMALAVVTSLMADEQTMQQLAREARGLRALEGREQEWDIPAGSRPCGVLLLL